MEDIRGEMCLSDTKSKVKRCPGISGTRDFVTRTIVRAGRYLSHCSCKDIVEAFSTSPPTNKSILTNDDDNSVVFPPAKRSKRYDPPAIHAIAFILTVPG
ncbi:uncharacterized protein TNCV_111401 [Trichonephila clavipes]|nr:uncharacterized protein TNCV_111401 [Trichonephila clavipes]